MTKELTADELWERAAYPGVITKDELGISDRDEFAIDPKVAMELLEKAAESAGVPVKELLARPVTVADLVNDDNRFKAGYHSAINDVIAEVCDNCSESPCYRRDCKKIAKLKQMRSRV